jgi:NTP pyrophosphatase (non-canonical NTP hydrolase)
MEGMFDFKELQDEQREWQKHNFPNSEAFEALIKIGEESGELMSAFIHQYQKVRTQENWAEKERDAVGDIAISIAGYCNLRGIDFQECIESVWTEVKKRDWLKFPKNGLTE